MKCIMPQDADCWGAMDFWNPDMTARKRTLTIAGNGYAKPPAGKGEKAYVLFEGDKRKAFLSKTERLKIANAARSIEMDDWKGMKVYMTCGPKKSVKGGDPVLGMVVIQAAKPGGKIDESRAGPVIDGEYQLPEEDRGDAPNE
jgi:hypothetical protein